MRLLLLLALSGCSLATVRGPSDADAPPRCTKRARFPIGVDAFAGALSGVLVPVAVVENGNEGAVAGVALGAAAVAFIASAIVGYRRSDECRQAWDAFER